MKFFLFMWATQHLTGVANAFFLVLNLTEGNYIGAAICALCVLVTASWRTYPPPRAPK